MYSITQRLDLAKNLIAKKDKLKKTVELLYTIPRSIMGEGYRDSLELLQKKYDIPFEWKYVKSGAQILDWIVPQEWIIKDAYIVDPKGKKFACFSENNLHVVNYSLPINKIVSLSELKKNLFTIPQSPDHIPYITSYYKRTWGFCISQNKFDSLEDGEYRVFIDSEHINGNLVYGEAVLPGTTKKEILLTSYLCHPQMANHELGGPIALCNLYQMLKASGPHKFTYRFLICPENIGSAAFLHNSGDDVSEVIEAGFILNCLAYGEEWNLKKSRKFNSYSDLIAKNTLSSSNLPINIIEFFPDGSDERQFCSPGYDWPISLVMKKMYGTFSQYHTSADDLDFINYEALIDSIWMHFKILMTAELDFIPIGRVQKGSPMLSRSSISLYPEIMNFSSKPKSEKIRTTLAILNMSDGKSSLLEIAERYQFSLIEYSDIVEKLCESEYIINCPLFCKNSKVN